MKVFLFLSVSAFLGLLMATFTDDDDQIAVDTPPALNFMMKSIDGDEVDLAKKYKGKVVVVVNVASKCGLTPQYETLQTLHKKYADQGLAILGFPCNQFGNQEPGSEAEIKQFCTDEYQVEFDLFSKVEVNGDNRSDLYGYLTGLDLQPEGAGDIQWNFEKFVINRHGKVIARFSPRVKPDNAEFVAVIEKAIAEK